MFDDFGWENLPPLLDGMLLTVFLVVTSGFLGTILGFVLGLSRTAPSRSHGSSAPSTSGSSVANRC